MKQREIIVEHKYIDNKYLHCFDDENYNLLELERKVYLNENKELLEIKDQLMLEIERLNNMIKQQNTRNSRQRIANGKLQEENKKYNKWIESLNKDNHRLNNIINELEEWLEKEQVNSVDLDEWTIIQVRDKIVELKGSDSNGR